MLSYTQYVFNVFDVFLTVTSEKCPWHTPEAALIHLKQIAAVLQELDGDMVHLTEV